MSFNKSEYDFSAIELAATPWRGYISVVNADIGFTYYFKSNDHFSRIEMSTRNIERGDFIPQDDIIKKLDDLESATVPSDLKLPRYYFASISSFGDTFLDQPEMWLALRTVIPNAEGDIKNDVLFHRGFFGRKTSRDKTHNLQKSLQTSIINDFYFWIVETFLLGKYSTYEIAVNALMKGEMFVDLIVDDRLSMKEHLSRLNFDTPMCINNGVFQPVNKTVTSSDNFWFGTESKSEFVLPQDTVYIVDAKVTSDLDERVANSKSTLLITKRREYAPLVVHMLGELRKNPINLYMTISSFNDVCNVNSMYTDKKFFESLIEEQAAVIKENMLTEFLKPLTSNINIRLIREADEVVIDNKFSELIKYEILN